MTSVMFQPELSQTAASRNAPAGVKSLLLHIQDDEGLEARLQVALAIARASSGHLACLQITPVNTFGGVEAFGAGYVMADIVKQFEAQEAALRARIESRLEKEDVAWSYEQRTALPSEALVNAGALADLIVAGRFAHTQSTVHRPGLILGDILQASHTPLLICSNDQKAFDPLGPAVVAWNGSFEAANALRAALPLLRQAAAVHIVTVDDGKHYDFPLLGASEYLSRHQVPSELVRESKGTLSVEDRIIATAQGLGASFLVMGAYGHSRAREFLFGGVTRSLLKDCPIPIVAAR
jgi:nucleotide-binding universal stress UspA family protein